MIYEIAADLTALVHLTFIAFVIFGAFLGYRSRAWKFLHLTAMGYGVLIEVFYWYCPLTYLEQYLRTKAGKGEFQEAFIAHYLNQIVYLDVPQWSLIAAAAVVLAVNLGLYVYWWRRRVPAGVADRPRRQQGDLEGSGAGGSRLVAAAGDRREQSQKQAAGCKHARQRRRSNRKTSAVWCEVKL